jgi:hypothetical protein
MPASLLHQNAGFLSRADEFMGQKKIQLHMMMAGIELLTLLCKKSKM